MVEVTEVAAHPVQDAIGARRAPLWRNRDYMLLWAGQANLQIQQCPAFDGRSNTLMDPYTGYNYNTSYVGHGESELIVAPARVSQIVKPAETALFGDGQWTSGADKFMRSPLPSPSDSNLSARHAGTQGFRHRKRTNVAFADGHDRPTASPEVCSQLARCRTEDRR